MQTTRRSVVPLKFQENIKAGLYFDLDHDLVVKSPTPPEFVGELKNYQSQALTWLLFREGQSKHACMDMTDIPYWEVVSERLNLK